jgi:hypothetical protein
MGKTSSAAKALVSTALGGAILAGGLQEATAAPVTSKSVAKPPKLTGKPKGQSANMQRFGVAKPSKSFLAKIQRDDDADIPMPAFGGCVPERPKPTTKPGTIPAAKPKKSKKSNKGAIIGGSVGGTAAIVAVAVAGAAVVVHKKRKQRAAAAAQNNPA